VQGWANWFTLCISLDNMKPDLTPTFLCSRLNTRPESSEKSICGIVVRKHFSTTLMPLQDRADSSANFELIRGWLKTCGPHELCKRDLKSASEFRLPARLIDVKAGVPRLVLDEDVNPCSDCRYVALSHCWGDPDDPEN
jgi:hypothetical protein